MPGIDAYTKLALHCDGTDGSAAFTDSSSSAHAVTASGFYYLALLVNGTFTSMPLGRSATLDTTSAALGATPRPWGIQSGQTSMPTTAVIAAGANPKFYLGWN